MYCSQSKIKKKVTFILAIAGKGKRMGLTYPKQFIEYMGEPLFYSSLKIAYESEYIDDIIISTNKESVDYIKKFCEDKKLFSKVKKIVIGGKERQNSIYNAIKIIKETDYVIIQDGVRPFMKEEYLKNILKELDRGYDGAIIGVKVKDTVKVIDDKDEVISTPPRDFLILTQTPQGFNYKILEEAHKIANKENIIGTDDAMLVENLGKKIKFIYGNYDNIKVTTKEDLKYLK